MGGRATGQPAWGMARAKGGTGEQGPKCARHERGGCKAKPPKRSHGQQGKGRKSALARGSANDERLFVVRRQGRRGEALCGGWVGGKGMAGCVVPSLLEVPLTCAV